MSNEFLNGREILKMVREGEISPEEALSLIRKVNLNRQAEDFLQHQEKSEQPREKSGQPRKRDKLLLKKKDTVKEDVTDWDVAIIGMSGRFPGADDIEEFWSNLSRGIDSVTEIPKDRWDVEKYYHPDINEPNKTYCKWGGMLSDVDKFDSLFFNISPLEAELMDPQHRLFLQEAWRAIENAGYAPEELWGKKCGVFVGVAQGDYLLNIKASAGDLNTYVLTGYSNNMLAARISYYLNLIGPNMPVDTACSSSLVAIHEAYKSVAIGESDMALAGGVCVFCTPEMHIMASKGGMLSRHGKCRTFDNEADGFVPGEGVGVLVLKKLKQAISDGDTVYGIIKGSAVNYDGKTNGITAPSVLSQSMLETEVYEKYGINPETISYIETHGTGTKLGDPIESNALTTAFGKFTKKRNFCALGSVKTNIGHSMTAAGVAGLIKILLCMKHKKLVPLLHFDKLNEHIKLEESPFYINLEYTDWKKEPWTPRRAAISSFGLSGTNCHMVIEEAPEDHGFLKDVNLPYYFIPLSAKTEKALNQKLKDMVLWLAENGKDQRLADISYTLCRGRSHFNVRAVAVVQDKKHLAEILEDVIAGGNPEGFFRGEIDREDAALEIKESGEKILAKLAADGYNGEEAKKLLLVLSNLYIKGFTSDFKGMFQGLGLRRIALPTYPFEKESYWISDRNGLDAPVKGRETEMKLHPLVGKNVSTLKEHRYTTRFSGKEFFFTDHVVNGKKMLPGAAYVEMAKAAAELATAKKVCKLKDVFWLRPMVAGCNEFEADIRFLPGDDCIAYEITSGGRTVHSTGRIELDYTLEEPAWADIDAVKAQAAKYLDADSCYEMHLKREIAYGGDFRTVKELFTNGREALSLLDLPHDTGEYALYPGLMDGALQTVVGLDAFAERNDGKSFLPFSVEEIEIYGNIPSKCYAHVIFKSFEAGGIKSDVNIYNLDGRVLVKMKNIVSRPVTNGIDAEDKMKDISVMHFREVLKKKSMKEHQIIGPGDGAVLVFHHSDRDFRTIFDKLCSGKRQGLKVYPVKVGEYFKTEENGTIFINPSREEDYSQMLSWVRSRSGRIAGVIHLWSKERTAVEEETLQIRLEKGVYSLLYFCKAAVKACLEEDISVLHMFLTAEDEYSPLNFAVGSFARSVRLEKPNIKLKSIQFVVSPNAAEGVMPENLADIAVKELEYSGDGETRVYYREGERYVRRLEELNETSSQDIPLFKDGGVYLITGGAGGLGMIFAGYMAQRIKARIVLTGRSEPDEGKAAAIARIEAMGSEIKYIRCDVSQKDEVERLVSQIKSRFGKIDGVIHSAGVIQDSFLLNKTADEMGEVFKPKIFGTVNLDRVLAGEKLDFFIMFSAIASVFGNQGQCDYAYANSFLDDYARLRSDLVKKGLRYGKTVSINWPLWKDGGMKIDEQVQDVLYERLGMLPLITVNGIEAFESALRSEEAQVVVLEGDALKIRSSPAVLGDEFKDGPVRPVPDVNIDGEPVENIRKKTEEFLKGIFAKATKISPEKIKPNVAFEKYGIDSIMVVSINSELEKHFGRLSKTLLFEYQNLGELTGYFLKNLKEKLFEKFGNDSGAKTAEVRDEATEKRVLKGEREGGLCTGGYMKDEKHTSVIAKREMHRNVTEDIAVIGVSGRYPIADNLDKFWRNLLDARDCITEIPPERWDSRKYFDSDKNAAGKTYSKWGGFIKDADKFDPLFFNISPREAETMDPQERIFLETVWKAVEDAGYRRSDLEGKSVGVFVGIMYGNYQLVALDEYYKGSTTAVNTSFSSIANRVSYHFNIQGPSIALDSMCSSSLTALHIACESIKTGECEAAIVGGVNLSLHPMKYLVLSQGKFVSTDGRCRSFGKGGDGYVPGEGVGAVFLKPLRKAEEDGDNIYAVIKATAINHGGKTNGYTVPNPNAQALLIGNAIKKAGIDPRTISCLEAHGTGTSLGDPIEIAGLCKAFGEYTSDKQFCSIGSVKSNIGHLESAAGIAGLTKVLLEMKHKTLVASLHSSQLNPNIDFENTPFYVQQHACKWERPKIKEGNVVKEYPRRAAVSAFGAGGSNAHVILEEYEEPAGTRPVLNGPYLFVLSAKNEERLKVYAKDMLFFLRTRTEEFHNSRSKVDSAEVENYLREMITGMLDIEADEIESQEDLFEYGVDNVKLSEIADKVRDKFSLDVKYQEINENRTLKGICSLICNASTFSSKKDAFSGEYEFLTSMAYTLQVGREAMEERLAVVASGLEELETALESFCDGRDDVKYIYRGSLKPGMAGNDLITEGQEDQEFIKALFSAGNLSKIAALWVMGVDVNWKLLYGDGTKVKRISLPTYPFLRKRYWIDSYRKRERIKDKTEESKKPLSHVPDWESMASEYAGNEVKLEIIKNNIALVTMQDRSSKNTFSNRIIAGLMAKFAEIKRNPSIKVVVVTGYDNIFCMGGTKDQLEDIANQKSKFTDAPFLYRGLLETDIPVISAMQGHASGGGMLFGLYGDIVVMAEEGVYSASFMKYGFTPGMGATFILRERFGGNLANEMMFTAKSFTGEELRERGVSVLIRKSRDVIHEALKIAEMLAEKPVQALRVLKKELAGRLLEELPEIITREELMHELTFTQPEVKERISSYYIDSQNMEESKTSEDTAVLKGKQKGNDADRVREKITQIVGNILHIPVGELNSTATFKEMGVDSISGVEIIRDINRNFNLNLDAVMLYDYPSIDSMTSFLMETYLQRSDEPEINEEFASVGDHEIKPADKHAGDSEQAGENDIEERLKEIVGSILHIPKDEVSTVVSFREMGVDSISGVEITRDINRCFGLNLDAVTIYDYPTISVMADHIRSKGHVPETRSFEAGRDATGSKENTAGSYFFKSTATYGRDISRDGDNSSARGSESFERPKIKLKGKPETVAREKHLPDLSKKTPGQERSANDTAEGKQPEAISEKKPLTVNVHAKNGEKGLKLRDKNRSMDIAVIGMSGRFPGAKNLNEYWSNLKNDVESIIEVPKERWNIDDYYDPDPRKPNKTYSRVGGFLEDVGRFDPLFFNISPLEAEAMDPQQRIFLEEAWRALEDAGYSDRSLSNVKCGVFVGATQGDYVKNLSLARAENTAEAFAGLSSSILAARISYFLNLKGPSVAIDTACSSSLVAIHQACLSILSGESDMALAGGVRLMFTPSLHIQTSKMEMLSPTGKCRAFDWKADGTIISEGAGVIVLKPLDSAIKDRDHIYGIIRGAGTNQDGKTNGITAPSAQAQTMLELDVYRRFGINPADITYVEAHGTGTKLGDPIEVKALKDAFGEYTKEKQFCAIGSVKTNIGHTTMAAGVASMIKVLLCFKHKQLPPSLNFERENEHIRFKDTPFYVNTILKDWVVPAGKPRLAAISSFGFSGTNCHIVVEESMV